jgi:hypothetical protein
LVASASGFTDELAIVAALERPLAIVAVRAKNW